MKETGAASGVVVSSSGNPSNAVEEERLLKSAVADKREAMEETFRKVSSLVLPESANSFGRLTCQIPLNDLARLYESLVAEIDFNNAKWMMATVTERSTDMPVDVDGVTFRRGTKQVILKPAETPEEYGRSGEQTYVTYEFYFDLKSGLLWAETRVNSD